MPSKHLCYFSSQRVVAYRWKNGALRAEASFGMNREGVADFSKYVAGALNGIFYVLADVVEEDFFQENIPSVHGADRRALLARKLAQRYRNTSLALPISLGSENHAGRREERILYTSFTNTQQFQPWIEVLRSSGARVAGVSSVALVAASVGKRLGFKRDRYLLVSLQQAGLRQSYVENGRIRFSRLGRVDRSDPRAVAQDCATESNRIYQYLANTRILPRDAPPLDVLVLAPSEHKAHYDAACVSSARLKFQVQDLDRIARRMGLRSAPVETLAEGLFLHVLADSPVGAQFADDSLRHSYDLWRARVGLVAGGAAVFGLCMLFSGANLYDMRQVNEQTETDRRQEALATEEYARLQSNFPKTPATAENLRAIVKNYQTLLRQSSSPRDMLIGISEAVTTLPQIEIDRINWEYGNALKPASDREASRAPPVPRAPSGTEAGAELQTQSAEISGRLILPQVSDYRAIIALVNRFTEALRLRPGTEVIRTQLPFDINAEKSLSGDIGAVIKQEVPRFSVMITRRGT
ncbi:MAG: hypothetical protein WBO23_00345 [Burkholderiales bacterium]